MESVIAFIITAIVVVAAGAAIISIISALLPVILGIGAIVVVLGIIGLIIDDAPSPSYTPSSKSEVAQVHYRHYQDLQVKVKPEVNLSTLQPAMDSAIVKIVAAFQEVLGEDYKPTITSGDDYDGHVEQSAHYSGAALDFRLKDIDDEYLREMVTVAVREALGERFFVDHEFPGGVNEHLHVQMRRGTYNKYAAR